MSSPSNQYGLSRHIPAEVARAVRRECGFGCVCCGASVTEYEHVDPEFSDAREHVASAIALLCPSCHANVTRRVWSKDKVRAARLAPRCREAGFSWGEFDFGLRHPSIRFGGVLLRNCRIPLAVRRTPLFVIQEPEESGAPFRLSAQFTNSSGQPILEIVENQWHALSDSWDVEFTGGRILIRESQGSQCLILRAEPPEGIAVEKLNMLCGNILLEGDETTLALVKNGKRATFTACIGDNCFIGLSL